MSKKRPSARNKKKKNGKKKENPRPTDHKVKEEKAKVVKSKGEKAKLKMSEEETNMLVDEFLATPLGQILVHTNEELNERGYLVNPDVPPCDGCMTNFSGTMKCARCESVFYCGRDCQVLHWSTAHRGECAHLKNQNEETAQRVLSDFKEARNWKDLDVVGAYKAAVNLGLHDKIREVLELDKAEIVSRYQNGGEDCICYTEDVMTVLFRGQRAEGRAEARSPSANCVDGSRIKGYVRSHPDALDAWLQASIQIIRAVTNPDMLCNPELHHKALIAADNVWCGWYFTFKSSTAARAILSPFPTRKYGATSDAGGDRSVNQRLMQGIEHARRVINVFGEALRLVDSRLDRESTLHTTLHMLCASVLVRTEEYGIAIDVEGILNMDESEKAFFQQGLVPYMKQGIQGGWKSALDMKVSATIARISDSTGLHECLARIKQCMESETEDHYE